jgi:hypothetical protein
MGGVSGLCAVAIFRLASAYLMRFTAFPGEWALLSGVAALLIFPSVGVIAGFLGSRFAMWRS